MKLLYRLSIIATILIALFAIIGAFASKVSPADSSFMSLLSLGLPALVAVCLLLVVYWAIRFRCWVWVPLVAVVFNWGFIGSMVQNPYRERELPSSERTLNIATFNTGRFGKSTSNLRMTSFFMAENQVDIICFQEFATFNDFPFDSVNKTILASWPYRVIPKSEKQNILPLAIYSRYPILDHKLITYPNTPNASMWCDISVEGKTIRVFNNHLQTTNLNQSRRQYEKYYKGSNSIDTDMEFATNAGNLVQTNEIMRAYQAETIDRLIKESPYPVLVCGDFNSIPSTYIYRKMRGDLKDGFQTSGRGYAGTYRYFKGLMRIDYIFHSPSFNGIDYYSTKIDLGSDHNPVLMRVEY
ncbi:endonuclease [Bacteroides sp. 214]|uniref:endonuclease/exonuclease/phosphatase family protein n=1 Tax=Bacteroides sp. 214 TaxID=2302935 RepID=UPI0013D4B167|nr:endonuclease/exonuclease/phosphatase family protein [Bacteroides sp. 214]NDW12742.1 endonuclease [Bacteroides sp. 214]